MNTTADLLTTLEALTDAQLLTLLDARGTSTEMEATLAERLRDAVVELDRLTAA